MARKKKAKKKTAKSEVVVKPVPLVTPKVAKVAEVKTPEPVAKPAPALVPEQMVTRRGTLVGGAKTMTRSEYDKQTKG